MFWVVLKGHISDQENSYGEKKYWPFIEKYKEVRKVLQKVNKQNHIMNEHIGKHVVYLQRIIRPRPLYRRKFKTVIVIYYLTIRECLGMR